MSLGLQHISVHSFLEIERRLRIINDGIQIDSSSLELEVGEVMGRKV